eukprot:4219247-Pleurochrysis_carterae.AAC.1
MCVLETSLVLTHTHIAKASAVQAARARARTSGSVRSCSSRSQANNLSAACSEPWHRESS